MTMLKPAADRVDSPTPSDIAARHGEDPARFLRANEFLALARIRGIEDLGLVDLYRALEVREFGSRSHILEALEQREAAIRERGPRLHPWPLGPRRQRESKGGEATWIDEDGEPYQRSENPMSGSLLDRVGRSGEEAIADGGESSQAGHDLASGGDGREP